jgi:acyl-coenzyme A thioesterase PaaI-like protein
MDAVQTSPSRWAGKWSLDQLSALTAGTLVDRLGIRFVAIAEGALIAEMVVGERTSQRMGYLHGGASLAMAETVGSLASQMAVAREQSAARGHVRPRLPKAN